MNSILGTLVVGIICIVLGILNTQGNISTLHSYHRKRVSEEDRILFGKRVGLGTIIIGAAFVIFSGFAFLSSALTNNIYIIVGSVVLVLGLVVGIAITFHAMLKYNKGIF